MMLKKIQSSICPNPDCERPFENLIVILDKSRNPPERFYGCPHCFFKMDPTTTCSLKNIRTVVVREEPNTKSPEEWNVSNCPKYFGFLADNISTSIIPRKCLECEKMDNCMKEITVRKINKR